MNAAMRDRSCTRNFAHHVGLVNITTKLVGFWFARNLCAKNRASGIRIITKVCKPSGLVQFGREVAGEYSWFRCGEGC